MKGKQYKVVKKYYGCTVGTKAPPYERKGKGVFKLDEATQKDLAYLFEVVGLVTHIEHVKSDEATPE